jgi:hypothetical protein
MIRLIITLIITFIAKESYALLLIYIIEIYFIFYLFYYIDYIDLNDSNLYYSLF